MLTFLMLLKYAGASLTNIIQMFANVKAMYGILCYSTPAFNSLKTVRET